MERGKPCVLLTLVMLAVPLILVAQQGFLHRQGKYIYDGEGREVILRGIGTGNWMLQEGYMMQTSDIAGTQHEFRAKLTATIGLEKTAEFYDEWLSSHFTKADVDSMKSWGFNSVRVAMHYKWFTPPIEEEPVPGEITWIDKGFSLIDSVVKWCSAQEMYVILDLHGAPGGQGKDANISDYDPTKPSLWESQANKDKTVALWRKIAERYSEEPWVGGYDLINETNWTFPEGNNSKLRELYVNITRAIREVDKNHLIFIEGNGFANDFSGLTPPWDNNMAYSFHKYWTYNTLESINFAIALRNAHNVPIWLGESGENSNVWFTNLISLCEKNRIGWAWWPLKKPGINNPLRVQVNSDYTRLINYWKGTATNPGADAAFQAVMQFARNHRIENCIVQRDVIDAMIRQPFTAETLPFRLYNTGENVFATNYNLGRNGYAYYDADTANYHLNTNSYTNWNQGWSYRNDGVDIQGCDDYPISNGYNVGWTETGEWLEYTIISDSTAGYTFSIRSASGSGGSRVRLELNGTAITPVISLPGTGGWQRWQTTTTSGVILPEGTHKVRLIFDQGGSNLNYFRFSDPVSISTIPFRHLFAETSSDGSYILLTMNKPVTSPLQEISPAHFLVTCDKDTIGVNSISLNGNNPYILKINLESTAYYGGQVRLTYNGQSISSSGELPGPLTNITVRNNLPVRYALPARIQAEDYAYNSGLVSEACSDAGGGLNMGHASPGDYLDYRVFVPSEGNYNIHFRVATIRSSSQLVVRTGDGTTFTDAGTLNIGSTGGWQNWTTLILPVYLPKGRYTLRLYVKSGEFNTNWFQVVSAPVTSSRIVHLPAMAIYPNPATDFIKINLTNNNLNIREISIYNLSGNIVKHIPVINTNNPIINLSGLGNGNYLIDVKTDANTRINSQFIKIKSD